MEQSIIDQVIVKIRALCPPFRSVDDATLSAFVELADEFVCEHRFGDKYVQALALYTLFMITSGDLLKSEEDGVEEYSRRTASFSLSGEFSQTFASLSGSEPGTLRTNSWGRMFEILNKKKGGGFGLITGTRKGCG